MPNRTPAVRERIDSMDKIPPSDLCNGRTPTGYCKNVAGFKTDHVGTGRCFLHGGRAGRPVVHGHYSTTMRSELRKKYEEIISDPALLDMYGELALLKTTLLAFLETAHSELSEQGGDFFTQEVEGKYGSKLEVSPKITTLLNIAESMSRLFTRITDAESKSASVLTPKYLMDMLNQIRYVMDKRCGDCPIRSHVGQDLSKMQVK